MPRGYGITFIPIYIFCVVVSKGFFAHDYVFLYHTNNL